MVVGVRTRPLGRVRQATCRSASPRLVSRQALRSSILSCPEFSSGTSTYVPVLNLDEGWNRPNDREQREMAPYVYAIMPWDGWQTQQYYLVPSIGWWNWRPEKHEFNDIRRRI